MRIFLHGCNLLTEELWSKKDRPESLSFPFYHLPFFSRPATKMVPKIRSTSRAEIQRGLNTHSQETSMSPKSFSTMRIKVRVPMKPIPDLFACFYSIAASSLFLTGTKRPADHPAEFHHQGDIGCQENNPSQNQGDFPFLLRHAKADEHPHSAEAEFN